LRGGEICATADWQDAAGFADLKESGH